MDSCIFCKIVKGEIPSYKVSEDDNFLAFLNIRPFKKGHTLVISKKHIDYLFDMEDEDLSSIIKFCKPVARVLKKAFKPKSDKIGVMVVGNEVPHVHIHLVPFETGLDLSFKNEKETTKEELEDSLEKISQNL